MLEATRDAAENGIELISPQAPCSLGTVGG